MRAVYRALVAPLAHRHVSLVCQRMDVRVGDVDGMDPYTNNSTPLVSQMRSATKLCATMHLCKQLASRTWR